MQRPYATLDGLRIFNTSGSLIEYAADQRKPRNIQEIPLNEIGKQHVDVLYPAATLTSTRQHAVMICWSLRHFYPEPNHFPSPMALTAGLYSYLSCVIPPDIVNGHGDLRGVLRSAGIERVERRVDETTLYDLRTREAARVINQFDEPSQLLFAHHRDQQVALLGILLLLMAKNVTADSYKGWLTNRLRTFRGTLGISEESFIWKMGNCPSQRIMTTLYDFLSCNQPIRVHLFTLCLRASIGEEDRIKNIFKVVVNLLRGVEMNHILMIDNYIFSKYPELLRMRTLRENMTRYNKAMEYLSGLTQDEYLYVKLLKSKEETAILNRNNFTVLSAAAYAVARFEIPSMQNYKGGNAQAAGGSIEKMVNSYLTLRMNNSILSMLYSPFAYVTKEEKEKILDDFKESSAIPQLQVAPAQSTDQEPQFGALMQELRSRRDQ